MYHNLIPVFFFATAVRGVCESRPGVCGRGRCVDQPGGKHTCVCYQGYQPNSQHTHCQDVNECVQSPGVCSVGECVNTMGSYRCVCPSGYRSSSQQTSCQGDVDFLLVCHVFRLFVLHHTVTTAAHSLLPSLSLSPSDIDEYVDECVQVSQCPGQQCVNTVGSYLCVSCQPGYSRNDGSCQDINECLESDFCFSGGECVNTPGSYSCVCSQGFMLSDNRTSCLDVDECLKPGVCLDGHCMNTEGSFQCQCQTGFTTNPEKTTCLDVDECVSSGGSVCGSQRCENTIGSYRCLTSCEPGYQVTQSGKCVDINECTNKTVCGDHAFCQNLIGTYLCVCDMGFTTTAVCEFDVLRECYYNLAEQGTCSLLATNTSQQECCCTLGEAWGLGCQYHACPPTDTAGFLSLCPSGRGYVTTGPGAFSYRDVDECKRFHLEVCKNGVCVNNIPGYSCYCSSGYVYNSTLLECVGMNNTHTHLHTRCECAVTVCVCVCVCVCVRVRVCVCVSDHDECEEESCVGGVCVNTVGSYYCSCQPPLVLDDTQRNYSLVTPPPDENLSVCWQHVSADLMCQSPLLGAQVTFTICCCLYGEGWGMECALCPSTNSGRYESFAGLSAAEDCGILHGCENGRCIRVAEGYTCDCYQGYELDMASMTLPVCVFADVNECEDSVSVEFPCVNARCVNTEGSFRCVCRRGYIMSRRPNHCVAA
uniref:Latent-transforming growth factor beta-binding protein 4 n=1 Tax=Seriola dumerili TaxID=41447 RepID=A0A3B4TVW3_SERDU